MRARADKVHNLISPLPGAIHFSTSATREAPATGLLHQHILSALRTTLD